MTGRPTWASLLGSVRGWFVERPGDRVKSKPRRFTAYEIDEAGKPFKPDPQRALFVLHEQGFYLPPD